MHGVRLVVSILLVASVSHPAWAASKEEDYDVLYDDARLPPYQLPDPLVTVTGERVTTPEQWFSSRRPEILSLFSTLVYGRVPAPADPIEVTTDVVRSDDDFLGGKGTRKEVRIRFHNARGSQRMTILVIHPNTGEPDPALLLHSFDEIQGRSYREDPDRPGWFRNRIPIGDMLDQGIGFVAVYQQDLLAHNEVEFQSGIHRLFYGPGQSFPAADEWGVLSTVAWGAMRALDYLETDTGIDAQRVAVMGHSKMGKAALWTAAQDERFALALSAQSGCAGAALWRRKSGETLEKMVTRFPYWLCRNAWKFVGQEEDLPVDQHMLLALIAPRPVYVFSGQDDGWADPQGEYLGAYHAGEVYRLLGGTAPESPELPPLGEPILDTTVGYHIRAGGHSVEPYDWEQLLDFVGRHLLR